MLGCNMSHYHINKVIRRDDRDDLIMLPLNRCMGVQGGAAEGRCAV